jgi:hypothetical protein
MLAVDVWTDALRDPSGALKWLAVGGTAVMTTDARRALMHEVNERKQAAAEAAAAELQRTADAAAAKVAGAACATGAQGGGPGEASALPHAPARAAAASAAPAVLGNRVAAAAAPGAAVGAGRLQLMAASLRGALQCVPNAAARRCMHTLMRGLPCAHGAGAAAPPRAQTPKQRRCLR